MEKSNLSLDIFDTLKKRIIKWEYLPGQRLTEESLCSEFGVSRVPVREALRMLEDNRLVDKIPYRGCTVKQPNLQEINDLYDVRLALELFVVEQLARQGMPPLVAQALRQIWESLLATDQPAEVDVFSLARQDEGFHETLAQATGNRLLAEQLHLINERLYFTRLADITTIERMQDTCRQHLHILAHIGAGDVPTARAAIQTNIEFGRKNVEHALKDALTRAYMSNME